ncbi:MAG: UDP-N-acetylglucosamine 2-epimerase (non-hydrolyzing) [Planctomycetes bacterium]|nr:UDP-N-acetylglucosamine 2-epimerase (non-hydrolyzing) [Planctomycetota bacterium]
MKAGPVLGQLRARAAVDTLLLHTGQHYDEQMSALFFRDLGLPQPEVNLGVGSGSHARQTAEVMVRFESYLEGGARRPACVVVVGDVNSTLACALVAAKAEIPLAHVEAGLRSFDRSMPEELNRICTDQLAAACYVTEEAGMENLRREGQAAERRLLVGNTMIDTLLQQRARAAACGAERRRELGVAGRSYAVCTLHRPSNVDAPATLAGVLDALARVAERLPLLLPLHPRTRARIESFGLASRLHAASGLRISGPLGYLDFLGLLSTAALVLTDSGGIQEEATVLKVPCVTLRENTERPVTLQMGGNVLAGADPGRIVAAAERMLALESGAIGTPPLWDGRAAERIAADLERRVAARAPDGRGGAP